jgi:hypothetical protein
MKGNYSYWRRKAAPIVAKVLAENKGKTEKELRAALKVVYPFGERKYHPYKIWCDEVRRQLGLKWPIGHRLAWMNSKARSAKDQAKFEEWERLYGREEQAS